jgi:hypothetical protein
MPIETLDIAEPFFTLRLITDEDSHAIKGRAIVLNLAETPVQIMDQTLSALTSVIVQDCVIEAVGHVAVIERFDAFTDEPAFLEKVRATWPSAYDVRREERLLGIGHYMSPKAWVEQFGFTFYHSATVPLNVGLHKDHDFCPVPGFREVHTQIVGFGKMQQCRERDIGTLYLEEPMAPGTTHRPMYDAEGNYPWHQFETITPSIFMAVEMLPKGAKPPA